MFDLKYRCPECKNSFDRSHDKCPSIKYTENDKPIFFDSSNKLLLNAVLSSEVLVSRERGELRKFFVRRYNLFVGKKSYENFEKLSNLLDESHRVLVIGGGEESIGVSMLRKNSQVVSFDIYNSPNVEFIADAHNIPLEDGQFDAVVIQAVLEHVIDPFICVKEIYRILKPNGIVYSEIPFLQAVHEEAFDFCRFSVSGHRLLYHEFESISYGVLSGPAESFVWATTYLIRTLFASRILAKVFRVLFSPLILLDRIIPNERAKYAACGTYFFGRKSVIPKSKFDYSPLELFKAI